MRRPLFRSALSLRLVVPGLPTPAYSPAFLHRMSLTAAASGRSGDRRVGDRRPLIVTAAHTGDGRVGRVAQWPLGRGGNVPVDRLSGFCPTRMDTSEERERGARSRLEVWTWIDFR